MDLTIPSAVVDPLEGTAWSAPSTVDSFAQSPPNAVLMQFAAAELQAGGVRVLDIGCGAGRNAVPLARSGWEVLGVDLSLPMLAAAAERTCREHLAGLRLAIAPMDVIPARSGFDLIVAHGIWNLARSGAEFRRAIKEAARVAKPGAALFVFTFSRNTLPADARPVPGESFVFTDFSGQPQCFLTARELISELDGAGFSIEPGFPLTEHNLPRPGRVNAARVPVIYEGIFRLRTLSLA